MVYASAQKPNIHLHSFMQSAEVNRSQSPCDRTELTPAATRFSNLKAPNGGDRFKVMPTSPNLDLPTAPLLDIDCEFYPGD